MEKRPIESVMTTAMESIREMVDISTVIGEPVVTAEGTTVIPISRVAFGFAAGGGESMGETGNAPDAQIVEKPFIGGSGAGVSVQPAGFLILEKNGVRLLPAMVPTPVDRLIEQIPQALEECKRLLQERMRLAEQKQAGAEGKQQ